MLRPSEQPTNWRTLLLLAAAALILTVWQHRAESRNATSLPERILVAVGRPLESGYTYLWSGPRDLYRGMVAGPALVQENDRLRAERDAYQAQVGEIYQYYQDNRVLLKSLGLPAERKPDLVPARVIGLVTGPSRCRATLALEQENLVTEGDLVRQAAGLVGRIIKVQGKTAEALLLIDPEAAVAGLDVRSRDQGIVYPLTSLSVTATALKMEKVKPLLAGPDLRPGDLIETSGLDEVYPARIPIGQIERVSKMPGSAESVSATLRPFVDFFRLEYVWVVKQKPLH
ncbi:MAG TPA: rod shape-determining protein MreC [Armatimonadota bacterium]|jgi:rod shape-determining protein MreC